MRKVPHKDQETKSCIILNFTCRLVAWDLKLSKKKEIKKYLRKKKKFQLALTRQMPHLISNAKVKNINFSRQISGIAKKSN